MSPISFQLELLRHLNNNPNTAPGLCRLVNNRKIRCLCNSYLHNQQRAAGIKIDRNCAISLTTVQKALENLIWKGKALAITCRCADKTPRGFDKMKMYYPHDGRIIANPAQKDLILMKVFPREKQTELEVSTC